jgi:hypothetical protein
LPERPARDLTGELHSFLFVAAMNYFRELLFRPKRTDGSLLARFYFADVSLNSVASELDSFDGRRDPDRCSRLVARLRACQDRLMAIIDSMMEEIEPGQHLSDRAFRAKFPGQYKAHRQRILNADTYVLPFCQSKN